MYFPEAGSFPKHRADKGTGQAHMGQSVPPRPLGTVSLKVFLRTDGCFHTPGTTRCAGDRRADLFSCLSSGLLPTSDFLFVT